MPLAVSIRTKEITLLRRTRLVTLNPRSAPPLLVVERDSIERDSDGAEVRVKYGEERVEVWLKPEMLSGRVAVRDGVEVTVQEMLEALEKLCDRWDRKHLEATIQRKEQR
jgi:hypothetical protein